MTSMISWGPATRDQPSFAQYFEQQFQCPRDQTSTNSLKQLSLEEIHGSGASLWTLGSLAVEQLTLGHFNYSWATNMVSTEGPQGGLYTWSEDYLENEIPPSIREENNVLDYIEKLYLRRALCAGVFLFRSSTRSSPERCPSQPGCRIDTQSASGPSGRPDREVHRAGNRCCLVEGKTRRVCTDLDTDVLEMISKDPASLLLYQGQHYDENAFSEAAAGKKKAMIIIYQV
jgi:hypothetical protein